MSAQACGHCRQSGHNARACPSRLCTGCGVSPFYQHTRDCFEKSRVATVRTYSSFNDRMFLALAAHSWDCAFCRRALNLYEGKLGEILVFRDLCRDGQVIVRDTPTDGETS